MGGHAGEHREEGNVAATGNAAVAAEHIKNIGLRGVTVADTMISEVDGAAGRLIYRGYDVGELAEHSTYEETAYLLIHGVLPTDGELRDFERQLGAARVLPDGVLAHLRVLPRTLGPMDALQAAVAALASEDPVPRDASKEAARARGIDLMGKLASLTAALYRLEGGADPLPASPEAGHAADLLRMLTGEDVEPEVARDMDVALILHAEHSFNPSTFALREVTSTRAHLYAAAAAAVGALSGELHGGANTRVMQMLQDIGDPGEVERYVRSRLETGERIMGMGHAVYSTEDPRAVVLRGMARRMAERSGERLWYELASRVEEVTKREFARLKGRDIYANVDLYSGVVYRSMAVPAHLFTPIFAVSRAAGWTAHHIEERFAEAQSKPALYRPLATYVGSYCGPEVCEYAPLAERSG